jgi:hypothetical protein
MTHFSPSESSHANSWTIPVVLPTLHCQGWPRLGSFALEKAKEFGKMLFQNGDGIVQLQHHGTTFPSNNDHVVFLFA